MEGAESELAGFSSESDLSVFKSATPQKGLQVGVLLAHGTNIFRTAVLPRSPECVVSQCFIWGLM